MAYSEINCRRIDHLLQSSCAHFFFFMRGATLGSCGGWGSAGGVVLGIACKNQGKSRCSLVQKNWDMNKKRSNGKHDNLGKNLLLHNCRQVVCIIISVRRGRDTALKKNCQIAGVFLFRFRQRFFIRRFSQFSRFLYIGIIFLAWERLRLQYNEKFRWPAFIWRAVSYNVFVF